MLAGVEPAFVLGRVWVADTLHDFCELVTNPPSLSAALPAVPARGAVRALRCWEPAVAVVWLSDSLENLEQETMFFYREFNY